MTDHDDMSLTQLREQARSLVDDLAGPLRRVQLRAGDASVEIEWHPVGDLPLVVSGHAGPSKTPQLTEVNAGPATVDALVDDDLHTVTSPMVGNFYRGPSVDEDPFVVVGDFVSEGQTVAIVEAMKLFNPILAECAGVVVELLVENGEPVQFSDALLRLRTNESSPSAQEV